MKKVKTTSKIVLCCVILLSNISCRHEAESVIDNNAELRDGKWYSDYLRFLEAGKKLFEITAWMPLPEPYKGESE